MPIEQGWRERDPYSGEPGLGTGPRGTRRRLDLAAACLLLAALLFAAVLGYAAFRRQVRLNQQLIAEIDKDLVADPHRILTLVRQGADVNTRSPASGGTPLFLASRLEDGALVEELLARGARVDERVNNMTPLCAVAGEGGSGPTVERLLAHGAEPNCWWQGYTPLMLEAAADHATTVRALLEHGAALNARDSRGRTALVFAARNGAVHSVAELVGAGADPEARDFSGALPIAYALSYFKANPWPALRERYVRTIRLLRELKRNRRRRSGASAVPVERTRR